MSIIIYIYIYRERERCTYIYIYIYIILIYIYRERERKREMLPFWLVWRSFSSSVAMQNSSFMIKEIVISN